MPDQRMPRIERAGIPTDQAATSLRSIDAAGGIEAAHRALCEVFGHEALATLLVLLAPDPPHGP